MVSSKMAKMKETNFTECMKWVHSFDLHKGECFLRAIKTHDKYFTPDNFTTFLKTEMIPIILEAGALNQVDIVNDWCLDTASQRTLELKISKQFCRLFQQN